VRSILRNPKYTGHMVFGRTRKTSGITRAVPPSEWLWSPEPSHPAIITRATYDDAQDTAASKAGSRDGDEPSAHAFTRRSYVLRSRLRCRDCRRRMHGITRTSSRYYATGPDASYTYYMCPHDAAKPRHAALAPDHPRSVSVREDALLTVVHWFFRERIFGPERAALLATLIPANATAEAAHRDKQETGLRKRLRQIDASENAQAREIEALAHVKDPHSRAVTAMRTRHLARFTELEDDRAQADAQLAALAKTTRDTPDPSLLDRLPMLGDLVTEAPIRLQRRLYEAFDLQLLYNKHMHQVTIWATITPTTPGTLAAIINDSDDGHPAASNPPASPATGTSHPEFSDPLPAPMWRKSSVIMDSGRGWLARF
jgi:site-specific DNA recombinase